MYGVDMARIKFMNTEIDNLTMDETLVAIEKLIENRKNSYIVTPNVDHIVQLESDKELQEVYENADLILCDGKPLIWISKIYRNPIKEKLSGSDLFPRLCEMAAQKGFSVYLMGAAEGVAAKAADNLRQKYKGLKIVGTYSPAYGFEKDEEQCNYIVQKIKSVRPDILIVGLGAPKQEKFMYKYRNMLEVPISLGLGASIDFEAGNVKRAPKWMSSCGLEWFYRFLQEPKRMFKRYFVNDMKIIKLIFKYSNRRK